MLDSFLKKLSQWSLVAAIALLFPSQLAQAAPANTAPKNLTQLLSELETAANNEDMATVRAVYSPELTTTSGLDVAALTQKLEQLWNTYDQLDYQVELENWEKQGETLVAETVTRIRGLRNAQGREVFLEATLRSRQTIREGQIVTQDMLSEQSKVYIGENAPRVKVNAPSQVQAGENFNFDVIVQEPIGDDILMGTALEEEVTIQSYLTPRNLNLEILPAGGIYRLGEAPTTPGQRWLSAIIIRDNGMTLVSQRVNIVSNTATLSNSKQD
ncbi:MAG: nuclear transport factor 2 family protein [Halothece sp. Uz-M2-17]|nr:nuclear transport factor 2 family protein [Halothece sp. Uz-M2-17]